MSKLYIHSIPYDIDNDWGVEPVPDDYGNDRWHDFNQYILYKENHTIKDIEDFFDFKTKNLKYKDYKDGKLIQKTEDELLTNNQIRKMREMAYKSSTDNIFMETMEAEYARSPEKYPYLENWYNEKMNIKSTLPLKEE